MFARLILALLLIAFVTPVATAAPCHGAAMTMTHDATGHSAPKQDATPAHICVGCIPPGDWTAERVAAPPAMPTLHPAARVARLELRATTAPGLRPPRGA